MPTTKKTLKIVGSVTAGLTGIAAGGLYLVRKNPVSIIFSNYTVKNEDNINLEQIYLPKKEAGTLMIFTHDYTIADVLIGLNENKKHNKLKSPIYCISNDTSDKINYITGDLKKKYNIELFFVGHTNNIVEKCREKLQNGLTVLVFLAYDKKSKGIYHIANKIDCNIITCKITSNIDINRLPTRNIEVKKKMNNSMMKYYSLDIRNNYFVSYHNTFDTPKEDETPEEYMTRLKKHLYLEE